MIFKKNPIPGADAKRFLEMTNERRKRIDETPATPLPKTYAVNELSKAIHPNFIPAKIVAIEEAASNCKVIRLEATNDKKRFPFFKAGQYVTLSTKVGDSFVTRPYSISSSPKEASNGIMEVTVQRAGFFSAYLLDEAKVGDDVVVGEPSGDFYYDNLRDKKTQVFYNSIEWKQIKKTVHIRDKGLCTMCLSENKISYAEVVHHIEPLKENYDKRISTDNLICLCNKHHAYVHAVYGSNKLNKANLQRKLVEMI